MKRVLLSALLLYIIIILSSCGMNSMAPSNNKDAATEIIKHFYADSDLERIKEMDTIRELSKVFEIECIRDPREFSNQYLPYIVFLSESGKRYYVFFQPNEIEINYNGTIEDVIVNERFLTDDEMKKQIETLEDAGTNWLEWAKLLEQFQSGRSNGNRVLITTLASQDGVFGICLGKESTSANAIQAISFFSDIELMNNPSKAQEEGWNPWFILPIDKKS